MRMRTPSPVAAVPRPSASASAPFGAAEVLEVEVSGAGPRWLRRMVLLVAIGGAIAVAAYLSARPSTARSPVHVTASPSGIVGH
jgi:hypothetical protein